MPTGASAMTPTPGGDSLLGLVASCPAQSLGVHRDPRALCVSGRSSSTLGPSLVTCSAPQGPSPSLFFYTRSCPLFRFSFLGQFGEWPRRKTGGGWSLTFPRCPVKLLPPRSRNHSSCISSVIRWCMWGREANTHHRHVLLAHFYGSAGMSIS